MFSWTKYPASVGTALVVGLTGLGGCRTDGPNGTAQRATPVESTASEPDNTTEIAALPSDQRAILLGPVGSQTYVAQTQFVQEAPEIPEPERAPSEASDNDTGTHEDSELDAVVVQAITVHPEIRRLRATAQESWARVPQVQSLPDPMVRGTVYGEPMMMADGEARGTFMISQTIPSLKRLGARAQQASFEALMNEQAVRAAEQRIAADIREVWYQLYLTEQLLRINSSNQQLVESLVTIATAQVEVGRATAGDVILGTLELSRSEEERLRLRQQLASRKATFNRLLNRPADTPVEAPDRIQDANVELSFDPLRSIAFEQQPEIVLARLQTQATAWGIRVAELERVPDLTLSYEQMFMRMDAGSDGSNPWQLGAGINLPLWHPKYDGRRQEASQQHVAAHARTEEVTRANEAMILDLLEQARAADRTANLYEQTILPQTRQGLDADQRAYGQGAVQFERVITNARNLLVAEAAFYRARSEKAIALARLEQTVGIPLPEMKVLETGSLGVLPPPD